MDIHYPDLSAMSKVNLFTSCIYNGQMTLKYLKGEQKREVMRMIQSENQPVKWEFDDLSVSEKMWIQMAKVDF